MHTDGTSRSLVATSHRSLAEHRLHAEPDRAEEAADDDGDHRFEGITLGLFDTLPPSPQMLKIGAQLSPILFLNSKRGQDCRDRPKHDRVDLVALQLLLFSQRFRDDRLDVVRSNRHRLMILATFSKPRLAK